MVDSEELGPSSEIIPLQPRDLRIAGYRPLLPPAILLEGPHPEGVPPALTPCPPF